MLRCPEPEPPSDELEEEDQLFEDQYREPLTVSKGTLPGRCGDGHYEGKKEMHLHFDAVNSVVVALDGALFPE